MARFIAHLVVFNTLGVGCAASQAAAGNGVAVREAGAGDSVGAAITEVQTTTVFTDLANRTRGIAVPAEAGIDLHVHAPRGAQIESRFADAVVKLCIADLMVARALRAVGAPAQAFPRAVVTIGEAAASDSVRATVSGVFAFATAAHVSAGA